MQANPQEASNAYTLDSATAALDGVAGALLGIDDDAPEVDEEAESDEETAEIEVDEEESTAEEGDEGEPEEESVALETIDDVAAALGVEVSDLMANLKMRIKVNGVEQLVSLAEAQKGNQLETDYRQKTSALADERRAVQAEREATQAQIQQVAVDAGAALQFAEQMLLAEVNNPAMQNLRVTNPAEWAAKQTEQQAKVAQLYQVRNQAQQQFQQAQALAQQQQQQHLQTYLSEQSQALATRVPDWGPSKQSEVATFLADRYGFAPDEIGRVFDHRLVLLAMDAQKGTKASEETTKVMAKVKTLPKVMPPGKATSKLQVKAKHIAGLKGQLKKTGHIRDAAKVIENFL